MNKLEVRNLSKAFGKKIVFKDLNFDLNKKEVLVIIGDSGSGKSTLLKCINLLEKADNGIIKIDDFELDLSNINKKDTKIAKIKSKIGMVFQDFNLWPHMSVMQNLIEAPIQVNKESKSSAQKRAIKFLKELSIEDKADQMPQTLSGGEKQRVAIARSLMMKPEIMLFDEPTSALDPKMVAIFVKIIKMLVGDDITIIISSHEISFVEQIADKVIFMSKNKILEHGSAEILKKPKTNELKQFLSSDTDHL